MNDKDIAMLFLQYARVGVFSAFIPALFLSGVAHATQHIDVKPQTPDKDGVVINNFAPYYGLSGGYGSFSSMRNSTGDTAVGRLAIGSLFKFRQDISLGGELGVQSGKRMDLGSYSVAPFFAGVINPLPVYLTINPVIDILGIFKYHFALPFFAQVKAGGVYMKAMLDGADLQGTSQWNTELQAGVGYDVTSNTRLVLDYQRFFGSTPTLKYTNPAAGTATLSRMPTWQGGLISIEVNF